MCAAVKKEDTELIRAVKCFQTFKSLETVRDSWTVAGREPSSILTVPQFPSASQVIIIHVFLKIGSLWEGKSESGLNNTMTLGGTPLSIISERRITWWAPSILRRDLQDFNYLCELSSQSRRNENKKRQGRRAIRGPCSTEVKLLLDLQPDKINFAFVDSEGHCRYACVLLGHLMGNSPRMHCACW